MEPEIQAPPEEFDYSALLSDEPAQALTPEVSSPLEPTDTPPVQAAGEPVPVQDLLRQVLEQQLKPANTQPQAQPAQVWRDPLSNPELKAQYDQLIVDSAYDDEKRAQLFELSNQISTERAYQRMAERQGLTSSVSQIRNSDVNNYGQKFGSAFRPEHYDAVLSDLRGLFGNTPEADAQYALTLQAPGIRDILAEAAAFRGIRAGQTTVAPNTAPAQPRSAARPAPAGTTPGAAKFDWANPDPVALERMRGDLVFGQARSLNNLKGSRS